MADKEALPTSTPIKEELPNSTNQVAAFGSARFGSARFGQTQQGRAWDKEESPITSTSH